MSSPMVRSVEMDLAVGESAGTSSPRPSCGENDEAKKFEEVSFIDGVLQGPQVEKVKAVLDEVHFEGLGSDVGEEDLDTGYGAKGFCTAGVDDDGVEKASSADVGNASWDKTWVFSVARIRWTRSR